VRDRDEISVTVVNETGDSIIVRPEAAIDNSGAWLLEPGDVGPNVRASAGSRVDVLSEDCRLIGQFVLPTRYNSGEPLYTVHPDEQIEQTHNAFAHMGDYPVAPPPGQDLCPQSR
jgi:hypothetical protein